MRTRILREGKSAQEQRQSLAAANKRRSVQGQGTRGRVLSIYAQTLFDTGSAPSARQIADEIGCERSTVARHISALKKTGLTLCLRTIFKACALTAASTLIWTVSVT